MNTTFQFIRKMMRENDYVDAITNISFSTMISINKLKQIIFENSEPTSSESEKLEIYFRYHK